MQRTLQLYSCSAWNFGRLPIVVVVVVVPLDTVWFHSVGVKAPDLELHVLRPTGTRVFKE